MLSRLRFIPLSGALLAWTSIMIYQSCSQDKNQDQETVNGETGKQEVFVGSVSCASCHQEEYDQWFDSHHAKAMMEARDSTVLGDFNNQVLNADGVASKFYKRDGNFYIRTEGPGGVYKEYRIKYTFGIEPLQQYLVEFPGGRLQATRAAWDTEKNKWFHLNPGQEIDPGDWLHWTRSSMTWNTMCAHCHSTNLRKNYDNNSDSFNTQWSLINVGCEGCHGPGHQHIQAAQSDNYDNDSSMMKMTPTQASFKQVESCAPCHSRRSMINDPHRFDEGYFDQYQPSILLDQLYHADGQIEDEVYVYGSFIQSRMYHSGIKCSDCHDPHSAELRLDGNELCMQCHQPRYDTKEHHFHKQGKGSSCISCHMPGKFYMVNDYRHDHSFRIPRPDLTVKHGTPNTCNTCHEDQTPQWAARWYKEWYGSPPEHFSEILTPGRNRDPSQGPELMELIRDKTQPSIARATGLQYLIESGSELSYPALVESLADSAAIVRLTGLGLMFDLPVEQRKQLAEPLLKDPKRSVRIVAANLLAELPAHEISNPYRDSFLNTLAEFKNSLMFNADFPSGQMLLGQYYDRIGQNNRAEAAYRKALKLDSLYIPGRLNLAQFYNKVSKNKEAINLLKTVIKMEPDYARAYYSLGLVQAEENNLEAAADNLEKARELNPLNTRIYYNLGIIYQNLDQPEKAEQVYLDGLNRSPSDISLHRVTAIFYLQREKYGKARKHVEFLSHQLPDDPQIQQMVQLLEQNL